MARTRRLLRRKLEQRELVRRQISAWERNLQVIVDVYLAMRAIEHEICALLEALLAAPERSASARRRIRAVYKRLLSQGVIYQTPQRGGPAETQGGGSRNDPAGESGSSKHTGRDGARSRRSPSADVAPKPERDDALRALYRKLALHFHPDRAESEEFRLELEARMREVNRAYHEGDTARLLAVGEEIGLDVSQVEASSLVLAELERQYEVAKAEVRALRHSAAGRASAERLRAHRRGDPTEADEMEAEAEARRAMLERTRDVVFAFFSGQMLLKDFLLEVGVVDSKSAIGRVRVRLATTAAVDSSDARTSSSAVRADARTAKS